ncbi:MAG TPA: hypothetical protein VM327_03755 [Candidatus Thermoplasmatota archaeon]|nr:hypothetical protein [Candidatus Thermoplasmatota archaeon]
MRWSPVVLVLVLCGCTGGETDLRADEACSVTEYDEATVNPPVYFRQLECDGQVGPGRATLIMEYCPYHPTLRISSNVTMGILTVHATQEGGEDVTATYPEHDGVLEHDFWDLDDNRRTTLLVDVDERGSRPFIGSFLVSLHCRA